MSLYIVLLEATYPHITNRVVNMSTCTRLVTYVVCLCNIFLGSLPIAPTYFFLQRRFKASNMLVEVIYLIFSYSYKPNLISLPAQQDFKDNKENKEI